jgi:hypothetical protein
MIKFGPTLEEVVRRILDHQREVGIDPPDVERARAEAAELHSSIRS